MPLLKFLGASETIIRPFQSSGLGDFAVAYLFYKLATPVRYAVTIGGTRASVRKLREWGYMEERAAEDSITNLMKDGREQMKTKISDKKEDLKEKVDDFKGEMKDKLDDFKEDMKSRKKN